LTAVKAPLAFVGYKELCVHFIQAAIMSTIVVAREKFSRSLSTEPLEPEVSPDVADAACIARAIAQRMDPEWREFVAQEQFERMIRRRARASG
jgi:hypothetical protein